MKAYSNDLRRKIIAAYENNDYSQQQVADLFGVSPATVRNLVRRKRATGSPDALPHAGGKPPALPDQARLFVQALVKENNDLTLAELRLKVERKHKKKVSLPTLCRVLQALGLPRKKVAPRLRTRHAACPAGAQGLSASDQPARFEALQVY